MQTSKFVQDQAAVEAWLLAASRPLKDDGIYVSYWYHNDGQGGQKGKPLPGFGIVIVDEGSGEFHLMPDGRVTRHVELGSRVVLDECLQPTDLQTFEALFKDFTYRILARGDSAST